MSAGAWPPRPLPCVPARDPIVWRAAASRWCSLVEPARRGLGGRNQQLVLAALAALAGDGAAGIALLSGGTDGEDGPTDAAGAVLDAELLAAARRRGLEPADFLARNDAYHFFAPLGGLLLTGPTHTNVCDLRVVLARPKANVSGTRRVPSARM